MKTLNKNEWIAVIISIFVVGFFFIFGQSLVSVFTSKTSQNMISQTPQVTISDEVIGSGDLALSGNRVVVHYTGRFVDGKVFDSFVTRGEPFQFVLGVGQVIKGWDEGIVGMKVGGERKLIIPAELGYGSNAVGPIPANSTLHFQVALIGIIK